METSYKKLWKILIDRDMSKSELRMRAHICACPLGWTTFPYKIGVNALELQYRFVC